MVTLKNIKNILKHSIRFCALAICFCVVSTQVVDAKTVDSEYTYIDETRMNLFKNIYEREDYKNYIMFSEVVDTTYSYTSYYLALTNSDLKITDSLNMSADIDKLYRYYRYNNSYVLEEVEDDTITITNSIYYTNGYIDKNMIDDQLLAGLNIGIFTILIFIALGFILC